MTRQERVHAIPYAALICVLVASGARFSQFVTSEVFWERLTIAYLGALVVYTWYLFALLLVHDVKPAPLPALRRSSTSGVQTRLRELACELPIRLHEFERNAGKREAPFHATTHMLDDDVAFVVTIVAETVSWTETLWDLSAPFLSFGLRVGLVIIVLTNPAVSFAAILPSWIMLLLIRYSFVPLRAPDKLLGLFLYMPFYELCRYWLNLWALFTVRNKSWVTRAPAPQPA